MDENLVDRKVSELLDAISGYQGNSYREPSDWFRDWIGGRQSDAGVRVSGRDALGYSSVFGAVQLISGDTAGIPLNVYRVQADGDLEVDPTHPAHWLLNYEPCQLTEPNRVMSSMTLREIMQQHAMLWGNGYSLIERDSLGRPVRLIPMLPHLTKPTYVEYQGRRQFVYESRPGSDQNDPQEPEYFMPENVLHVPGLSYDGVAGYSVISLARNSWGMGLAAEKFGNSHFRHGGRPNIVLQAATPVTKEKADQYLASWEERHSGPENAGRPALLSGNTWTITPIPAMSNADAEWLATRKFQRVEVAAWFNLPPHKLGDDSRLSYNSIEAENKAYVNQTLRRWFRKWSTECERKLLTDTERRLRRRVIKHDPSDLIGVDMATMSTVWSGLVSAEIATRNEARVRFGLPRSDDPKADELSNPNTGSSSGRQLSPDTEDSPQDPASPDDTPDGNQDDMQAAVVTTQRALLQDRLERFLRNERSAVGRKAKQMPDPEKFTAWLYQYYASQQQTIAGGLEPVVVACCAIGTVACSKTAAQLAETWCGVHRTELLDVAGYSSESDLHDNIVATFDGLAGRPLSVACSVIEGVMTC